MSSFSVSRKRTTRCHSKPSACPLRVQVKRGNRADDAEGSRSAGVPGTGTAAEVRTLFHSSTKNETQAARVSRALL